MNIFASNTLGAQVFFVISIFLSIVGFYQFEINFQSLGLILIGYFLYGCLGIVVTYHRNLTHKSYTTYPFITKFFSILGCLGGTGSPLAWVAIHINHHRKSDKKGDPHSPLYQGIKVFTLNYHQGVDENTKWKMKHIIVDKFHQFLHRYYFAIILLYGALLYLIGGIYLMIFLHSIPVVITIIMSNVVNYIGHKPLWLGGYRTYKLNDQSANNWLWAIPTWGETWHNNHHRHPRNFSCGEKWWELDISALVIRLIKI
ncbi:MAG: acyl-CoA desaturase [Betaproteobacteria bacterium]|nr:acyl-CoA desaturase [Betaproteobacteria bacterium]NCA23188.1 acyl-CoA desaturase [Betaproteobacteria bacterium]